MNVILSKRAVASFYFIVALTLFSTTINAQTNSVTIGSTSVNSNAVLWLVPNGGQGLLLPSVNTATRTSMSTKLQSADKGMMIFDSDLNKLFVWDSSNWIDVLSSGSSSATVTLNGDVNGPSSQTVVGALQGHSISTTAPTDQQVLKWNSANGQWTPSTVLGTAAVTAGAGINVATDNTISIPIGAITSAMIADGTISNIDLGSAIVDDSKISGVTPGKISSAGAATGQVLKWTGTAWAPAADNVGSGSVPTLNDGQILSGNGTTNTNTNVAGDLSLTTSGSTSTFTLANSGVTAQTYGDGKTIPQLTVDSKGRITNAVGVPITTGTGPNQIVALDANGKLPAVDGSQLTGLAGGGTINGVTAGTGLTGGGSSGTVSLGLSNTLVTTGTYGDATHVGQFTVDQQGRITTANTVTITGAAPTGAAGGDLTGNFPNPTIAAGKVTSTTILDGTILDADISTVDASKITTGTLPVGVGGTGTTSLTGLLMGNGVNAFSSITTGTNGQVLTVNAGAPQWATPSISGTAGGSLAGTYPNPTIAAAAVGSSQLATSAVANTNIANLAVDDSKIAGVAPGKITAAGATTGQVLKWDGTAWSPAPDDTGTGGAPALNAGQIIAGVAGVNAAVTVGLDATLNSSNGNITVQGLQGRPIAATAPVNNSVYQYNGTNWTPVVLAGGGTVTSITAVSPLSGGVITGSGSIGITAGGITSTQLAAAAVTNSAIAANAVNSSQVIDGTIVDADISSTAAIAVTKLATGTNGQVLTVNAGVPSWQTSSGLTNPMTSIGDIITGGISGTPTRLAAGTTGQLLQSNGAGAPTWVNAPPPSGTAGGDLTGTYPNPNIGIGKVTTTSILDGTILDADISSVDAAKITTGTLPVTRGGSGIAAVIAGGVAYGGAANFAFTPIGTAGQFLKSNGSAAPTWVAAPGASGTAGGDLSGTFPNPAINATAIAGGNITTAINLASSSINGVRVNPDFGAQNVTTTGIIRAGQFTTQVTLAGDALVTSTNNATTGLSGGVFGSSSSPAGYGVWGNNTAASGGYGIYGTGGTSGLAGFFDGHVIVTSASGGVATLSSQSSGPDITALITLGNSDGSHFMNFFPGRQTDPNPFLQWKGGDPLRFTTDASGFTELMRIDGSGKVGIATITPTEKLDVVGNVKFSGALMPNNLPGTAGQVLTSAGAGLSPTWGTAGGGGWGLTGTAGTVDGVNFIGTTDNVPLTFKTNNTRSGRIDLNSNVFFGMFSGGSTTGSSNTAYGNQSLGFNTSGNFNTAIGNLALDDNTTGVDNTAVGGNALLVNTTSSQSTAVGFSALGQSTGAGNTSVGYFALNANTTGTNNTAIGFGADVGSGALTNATAIGYSAVVNTSGSLVLGGTGGNAVKVGVGTAAPTQPLDVVGNVKFSGALMPNNLPGTAGQVLTSAGAGLSPTWGSVGGGWGLTGNSGTVDGTNFIGTTDNVPLTFKMNSAQAGRMDLNSNVFFGPYAGVATTGTSNSAFGSSSLVNNTTGTYNTAVGILALSNNTTGTNNTGIGTYALIQNTSASNSTALGFSSLSQSTGASNTAVGHFALLTNTTGANNTAIGAGADVASSGLTNATAIGYNAVVGASNSLVLGGTGINAVNVGIGTSSPGATNTVEVQGTYAGLGNALYAQNTSSGNGIYGYSTAGGNGVWGFSPSGNGVQGQSNTSTGVYASSVSGYGIYATSSSQDAGHFVGNVTVTGGTSGDALYAQNTSSGNGIHGYSTAGGNGVWGRSPSGNGLRGDSNTSYGLFASSTSGSGIYTESSTGYGIYATSNTMDAGHFVGSVTVTNGFNVTGGTKNFKIDHPLDPANKYLYHASIESSEVLNLYNGIVVLDVKGEAIVKMPDWFETLNKDFRYQLTCIGGFAQVYIAEEMKGNEFKIAGGKKDLKVSWQVTGVRNDAYMKEHPFVAEVEKTGNDKGKYLNPVEHGASETLGINYVDKNAGTELEAKNKKKK